VPEGGQQKVQDDTSADLARAHGHKRKLRQRLHETQRLHNNLLEEVRKQRKEERLVVTDPQLIAELTDFLPIMEKTVSVPAKSYIRG
jgi:hypothetical protein